MNAAPSLSLKNLCVDIHTPEGTIPLLDDICLDIPKGKTLGIVGESGCGKSMTALAIMRLLPQPTCKIRSGEILFDGIDLATSPGNILKNIRGKKIAMIFQEPMTALNPVRNIYSQMQEMFKLHMPELNKSAVKEKILHLLTEVGLSDPQRRLTQYPHELSGGMRQRVMIAMALACNPDILIADEPTTALDVTIQAQILHLIRELQQKNNMTVLLITHDLGVVAQTCDEVAVMYAGRIIEKCDTKSLFGNPLHPYTQGLLNAIPRLELAPKTTLQTIPGQVPTPAEMPEGCRFRNRCIHQRDICNNVTSTLQNTGTTHLVNCIRWQEI